MKMIRLEGMLLKKPLLILLLMSAALIPAVSLMAGIVSVEARYLITSAVFLLLMAAALLRRRCMWKRITAWSPSCRSMCAGISAFKAG